MEPRKRLWACKKATSPSITTVILTAVILTVVISASVITIDILRLQSQQTEFEQAERVLTSLADITESITYSSTAAGYVKFRFVSSRPNLVETGLDMTITTTSSVDPDKYWSKTLPINTVVIDGGQYTKTFRQLVTGTDSMIVVSPTEKIAKVQTVQLNGAKLVLDFARFKIVNTGVSLIYDSEMEKYVEYNVVELSAVNVNFGKGYGGSVENMALVARNTGVDSYCLSPLPAGDVLVTVTGYEAATGERLEAYARSADLGLRPGIPTIVRVSIFHLTISEEA